MNIKGRVFIVTGAASGLGAATAEMILAEQGHVIGADINPCADPRIEWVKTDVSREEDGQKVVSKAREAGNIGGLINCAGIGWGVKIAGSKGPHSLQAFQRVIDVNLVGTFNMSRLAAQAMLDNEPNEDLERGVIINTASVAAFEGQVGQVAYAASKAGIVGMTIAIARDLSQSGIRCCTIAPGLFETPLLLGLPAQVQQALGASVPFPSRLGRPREYARMARAIIENPMVNGETVRLDGALRMAPR